MGYVRHNAIVATSWQEGAADILADYARSVGAEALVGSATRVNGYQTVCITPDGSKEGWGASNEGDEQRNKIVAWLREKYNAEPAIYFEWCEIHYGDDDGAAGISRHGWEDPPPSASWQTTRGK